MFARFLLSSPINIQHWRVTPLGASRSGHWGHRWLRLATRACAGRQLPIKPHTYSVTWKIRSWVTGHWCLRLATCAYAARQAPGHATHIFSDLENTYQVYTSVSPYRPLQNTVRRCCYGCLWYLVPHSSIKVLFLSEV